MESGVRSTSAPQETHVCAQRTSDPALPLDLWVRILTRALAPASQTGAVTGVSAHHHARRVGLGIPGLQRLADQGPALCRQVPRQMCVVERSGAYLV